MIDKHPKAGLKRSAADRKREREFDRKCAEEMKKRAAKERAEKRRKAAKPVKGKRVAS